MKCSGTYAEKKILNLLFVQQSFDSISLYIKVIIHLPYLFDINEDRIGGRSSHILLSYIFNIYEIFSSKFL